MGVSLWVHVDRGEAALTDVDGRGWAFDAMYRRWYPDVVMLCRRLLGRTGDAEATAQEAFVRAWSALDRYSPARPFWPWISAIAQRLCFDHRRRFLRESRRGGIVDALTEEPHPEVVIEVGEDLRLVFRAIDGLRPQERRALMLREIDGWSYQQIAVFEGVTIESVRGSLKRARASVRRAVSA